MKANEKLLNYLLRSLAVLVLLCSNAFAQEDAIDWNSLNEPQQRVLQQYQKSWDSLDVARQHRLASGSARWVEMSGKDRAAAQERFTTWRSLATTNAPVFVKVTVSFRACRVTRDSAFEKTIDGLKICHRNAGSKCANDSTT